MIKKEGYSIDIHFKENPYFENKVLKKFIYLSSKKPEKKPEITEEKKDEKKSEEKKVEELDDDEDDLTPTGTEILWKKDQNLNQTTITKKKEK